MTHEELLAKFENWGGHTSLELKYMQTLRAIVKLHKPTKEEIYGAYNCEECRKGNADRWIPYPCRTIEAIEGQFG